MKKSFFLIVLCMVSSMVFAQTTTTTPAPAPAAQSEKTLADVLGWMIGTWEGEGVSGTSQLRGKMSISPRVDGAAVLVEREGGEGKKELWVIGYDATSKKLLAVLYDNRGSVTYFTGDIKENQIDLTLTTQAAGYSKHCQFRLLPEGNVGLMIEGSTPGKPVTKWVELTFKKKI